MPLTEFQRVVLQLLRRFRNPNSYVAGGIAIHRAATSSRYSNDVDFFHDTDEAVISAFNSDIALLKEHGYTIHTMINQPSFVRSLITKGEANLKLES